MLPLLWHFSLAAGEYFPPASICDSFLKGIKGYNTVTYSIVSNLDFSIDQ